MHVLKTLTKRQWAWIHFKLSLGLVWALFMAFFPPRGVVKALDQPLISVWVTLTIAGMLTSLVGYIMSQRKDTKAGVLGISVEVVGLSFFSVGPFVYFLTQLVLAITESGTDRIALTAFAYAMCSVILYRFVVVIPRFRQEASDESKEI